MSNKNAAHIRIVIDSEELFDGDLDQWAKAAPERFAEALQPGAQPQPWMKAILVTMADAAMTGDNVTIEANTGESHWMMEVTKHDEPSPPQAAAIGRPAD